MKRIATLMMLLLPGLGLAADKPGPDPAQELLMVRVNNTFPSTMNALQNAVVKQGYQLARVQRVDVGLTKSGYKTAEYRIVFFGKKKKSENCRENTRPLSRFYR